MWEGSQPYLVGRDHEYRVPLKGSESTPSFEDRFKSSLSDLDKLNNRQVNLLWEAVVPELIVDIELYIEGERMT